MKDPAVIRSDAWLLRGVSSIPGQLTLTTGGRLSFLANCGPGTAWGWQLRKIERLAAQPGLAKRINAGEDALVFDAPLDEVSFSYPWYFFSGGFVAKVKGAGYRFSLGQPANTRLPPNRVDLGAAISRAQSEIAAVAEMRRVGKAWRAAITQASVHAR